MTKWDRVMIRLLLTLLTIWATWVSMRGSKTVSKIDQASEIIIAGAGAGVPTKTNVAKEKKP